MGIAGMMNRGKGILLTPKSEWPQIETENAGHFQTLRSWLLPLSLLAAVAAFIGCMITCISTFGFSFTTLGLGLRLGLRMAVLQLGSMIGGAYLTAFVVNALAEKYVSRKNLDQAFALIAYAYTPACLGGMFQIIPPLATIGSLVGLYSLYLLYIGLQPMMKTPPEKNTGYFVVSLLCVLGVYIILSVVLAALFMPKLF